MGGFLVATARASPQVIKNASASRIVVDSRRESAAYARASPQVIKNASASRLLEEGEKYI